MRLRLSPGVPTALAAGVVHAASFAPLDSWPLQLAALAVLAAWWLRALRAAGPEVAHSAIGRPAIAHTPVAHAATLGFAFGLGWFVAGVAWLYVSMHRYGGMPAPLAALAVLLFGAYLAAFPAAACALAARVAGPALRAARQPAPLALAGAGLAFAGCWGLAEIARGYLFTGFPWLATGYAHVDGPLAGLAPLAGVYGISTLAAASAFGLGAASSVIGAGAVPGGSGSRARAARLRDDRPRVAMLATAAALALLPLAAGWASAGRAWSQPTGREIGVRLLQGNVPQELKFDPARTLSAMRGYIAQTLRARADLTVLPETAWTVPWAGTPRELREELLAHLRGSGGVVAIGMPLPEADPAAARMRLTNSVAAIDASGAIVARYDKRHLVPFGEFVPTGFRWFVELMNIPLGEFARGAPSQPLLEVGGQRIAFDVCYEDLFGEELARQVRDGATILVNLTNIAWFGDSHALPQHLQIARMRAIELARPMLRATNTGMTAAIDARGKVVAELPAYTEDALALRLRGSEGLTPYARHGNALPFACALAFAGAGALGALGARRSAGPNPLE